MITLRTFVSFPFLLVAFFSCKNINYGHGIDRNRLRPSDSPQLWRWWWWGKSTDRIWIYDATDCERKPTCCCTLHTPKRLVSAAICLIRALVDYLATLTPNSNCNFHIVSRGSTSCGRKSLSVFAYLTTLSRSLSTFSQFPFDYNQQQSKQVMIIIDLCRSQNWVSKAVDCRLRFFSFWFSNSSFSSQWCSRCQVNKTTVQRKIRANLIHCVSSSQSHCVERANAIRLSSLS